MKQGDNYSCTSNKIENYIIGRTPMSQSKTRHGHFSPMSTWWEKWILAWGPKQGGN